MNGLASKVHETKWIIEYAYTDEKWRVWVGGIRSSDMLAQELLTLANSPHGTDNRIKYRVVKEKAETVTSSLVIE